MSYTPINSIIFTAAYSGALEGMVSSGRYIEDTDEGDYAALAAVAGAFAMAYDQAWDSAAAPSQLDVQAAEVGSLAAFQDRQPILTPVTLLSTTWQTLAEALVATIIAAQDYFESEGISSPAWPSGGGGGGNATEFQSVPIETAAGGANSEVYVYSTTGPEFILRQLTTDDIAAGFSITGFAGGSTVETGATVTNPSFTASYSSLPTSAHITNTDGIDSPLVLTTPFTAGTVTGSFTHSAPTSVTFTLTAIAATTKTATQAIAFVDRTFGGIGTPGATSATASGDAAVLNGGAGTLSDSNLAANVVGQSFGPFSPVGQVIYILLPAGTHTFEDGEDFPFVMTAVTTFSFTNQEGAAILMTLWASNTLSSPFTVTVAS